MSRFVNAIVNPRVVLLVEDNETDRTLFRASAKGMNMTLITAESGPDALGLLKARSDIDLVVLDEMLIGQDGLEVFRDMRALGDDRQVVFLTGRGGSFADKVGAIGPASIFAKPQRESRDYIKRMLKDCGIREIPETVVEKQKE